MRKILMGVGAALLLSLATVVPAEAKDGGHSSGSHHTGRSYDSGRYRGNRDYRGYRGDRDYRRDRDYRGDRDRRGDRDYFSRYREYFYGLPFFRSR